MSPDGQTIVTGAGDETLRFWNVFAKSKSFKVQYECIALCFFYVFQHTTLLVFLFFCRSQALLWTWPRTLGSRPHSLTPPPLVCVP